MRDKTGRNIDYLRVSLTDRCNLRCIYCMPEEGIDKKFHNDILRYEDVEKIITASKNLGIKKVRFTGGEPLILKDIDKLIAHTSSMPSINDIALTTNGILLADMAEDLKKVGLSRVNISLDTLQNDKYKNITRLGNINKVYESIEKCLSIGLTPLKINTVLMKDINDDEVDDFINLTKDLPIQVRFIELMPLGEGLKYYDRCSMTVDEIIVNHPELLSVPDNSKVASVYKLPDAMGSVGFIRPISCKFCKDCNRVRLTSSGTIKPCLHSADEIDLKPFIHDEKLLEDTLRNVIFNKPEEHHLERENKSDTKRMMFQIGG